jgi:uroporphyrinogen decarboxylase
LNIPKIIKPLTKGYLPPLGEFPEFLLDFAANVSKFRGRFQKLTSVERVLTAIRHKEPDHVPVATIVCAGGRQVSGITFPEYSLNAEKAAQAFVDGLDFTGGDVVVLLLDLSVEASDLGKFNTTTGFQ